MRIILHKLRPRTLLHVPQGFCPGGQAWTVATWPLTSQAVCDVIKESPNEPFLPLHFEQFPPGLTADASLDDSQTLVLASTSTLIYVRTLSYDKFRYRDCQMGALNSFQFSIARASFLWSEVAVGILKWKSLSCLIHIIQKTYYNTCYSIIVLIQGSHIHPCQHIIHLIHHVQ